MTVPNDLMRSGKTSRTKLLVADVKRFLNEWLQSVEISGMGSSDEELMPAYGVRAAEATNAKAGASRSLS
jgi:hypothetical protein